LGGGNSSKLNQEDVAGYSDENKEKKTKNLAPIGGLNNASLLQCLLAELPPIFKVTFSRLFYTLLDHSSPLFRICRA
jgi:hypothetical protein